MIKTRLRNGYSLAEMALAVMAVSLYLGGIMWTIVGGVDLVVKADNRTIALALAQAKMSQLLNNPNLSPSRGEYRTINNSGIYNGFRWQVEIKQDKVNLAEVSEKGSMAPDIDDQLPASVQNPSTREESAGSSTSTVTGGDIEILRIIVSIKPPEATSQDWVYRVVSFQPLRTSTKKDEEQI
ncbi:MAG: hypothetical protein KDK39_02485 [Leptospiraceae bacterium]|nr:hypothetical protein [Leptospiraceae bacterium]